MTFPGGDVAFFKRNAGAGKLGLKLVEDLGAGGLVDVEDSNVSVWLGDEVPGYTLANDAARLTGYWATDSPVMTMLFILQWLTITAEQFYIARTACNLNMASNSASA